MFSQLSKKYGPVFTVHFGPTKVVVLAGYEAVREALVSRAEEFGDREISPIFNDINQGHGMSSSFKAWNCISFKLISTNSFAYLSSSGIIFANGDSWKEMRRFALTTLRDFGMGKRTAEEKIIEECHYLTKMFEEHKGRK